MHPGKSAIRFKIPRTKLCTDVSVKRIIILMEIERKLLKIKININYLSIIAISPIGSVSYNLCSSIRQLNTIFTTCDITIASCFMWLLIGRRWIIYSISKIERHSRFVMMLNCITWQRQQYQKKKTETATTKRNNFFVVAPDIIEKIKTNKIQLFQLTWIKS